MTLQFDSYIIGIDLSGPSNSKDTVCAAFRTDCNQLVFEDRLDGADDRQILEFVQGLRADNPVVGLDAPLAYNIGGKSRPADNDLRKQVTSKGLHPGSVMAPTMNRMAYLTLRGISVARLIEREMPQSRIVEVHPGASMALRGADIAALKLYKKESKPRAQLLDWLTGQGLAGLPDDNLTDHVIDAYACALTAWKWSCDDCVWHYKAKPPFHPYDFSC